MNMKKIEINTKYSSSTVYCGTDAFDERAPLLKDRQLYIITDGNVFAFYRYTMWEVFGDFVPIHILPAGETAKTFRYVIEIIRDMIKSGIGRDGCVLAIGGGVVGDIAGLVASIYMRGIHFVQMPTSLLAMVDSSVGGKTAIDLDGVKNVVGTFYPAEEVIIDPDFLLTIPYREIRCGLGEIVKYGALDENIYNFLYENFDKLAKPDKAFIDNIIPLCVEHKASVVREDEFERTGLRKSLNMGHTTGHAFELTYARKTHGEFVLIGMYYELYIATIKGVCKGEYSNKIAALINQVVKHIPAYEDIEKAVEKAKHDKKNTEGLVSIIVPTEVGKFTEMKLEFNEYKRLIVQCRDWIRGDK